MRLRTAERYAIGDDGAILRDQPDGSADVLRRLPPGMVFVCAEISADEDGEAFVRLASPSGWVEAERAVEAPPRRRTALDWETFQEQNLEDAPGDSYGIHFPFTHDALRTRGASFLTEAFRASGVLDRSNRVVSIDEYEPISLGAASIKARLKVSYDEPDPSLHTELFVKMPHGDLDRKFISSHTLYPEIEFAIASSRLSMPVNVAKYYFGDYSGRTTNGILITEHIRFGVDPIEPVYDKGLDHRVPDVEEHYRVLTRSLARLLAFHRREGFGVDSEEIFPFSAKGSPLPPVSDLESKVDDLVRFFCEDAPQFFPEKRRSEDFVRRFREGALLAMRNLPALSAYLHSKVDYTGFCHPNLNLDNAWFWRDEEGALQTGLIDWGRVGQRSIGLSLYGMLMVGDPETYLDLKRRIVEFFVVEYSELGGPSLDVEELKFHLKVASLTMGLYFVLMGPDQFLGQIEEAELRSIRDRFDPRIENEFDRRTLLVWLGNVLSEWDEALDPGAACREVLAGAE